MNNSELKEKLEAHYLNYRQKFSSKDPVWILHRFTDEKDIELIGLITAAYAYGSVDQINRFINELLLKTGNKPYEFTINFSKRKDKKHLSGLYYRFNSHFDLLDMFSSLNKVIVKHGSLKNLFLSHYEAAHTNIIPALSGFTNELNKNIPKNDNRYYHYLFSNPVNKSTCKRMNLFLRWMVRKDNVDLGLWNEVDTSKLIMPVDTHIARISKKLKLVNRKSIDLKFAMELTNKLKEFDPFDPVKYDFALCHIGIDKKEF
ncbi:MAG: TIGR02757 family protein [Ignavibacteria bacterium]|nr:TIGR02757 family protein [Ignavibacteria bacterium]